MKRLFLTLILSIFALSVSSREIYNLNEGWSFSTSFNKLNNSKLINLPHVWGVDSDNKELSKLYKGACYYLKEIKAPATFKDKDVYLRFGSVGSVATLYVNGKYVYEHKGAFTAFNVNITPFLKVGEYNSLLVVVSNAPRSDVMPFMSSRNIYGGINSDVELIALDKHHISLSYYGSKGVFIRTTTIGESSADIEAVIRVKGEPSSIVGVDLSIAANGDKVASNSRNVRLDGSGEGSVILPITIDNPTLWQGVENPFLYHANIQTRYNNVVTDSLSTRFGIRDAKVNELNQFVLNNKPTTLRGVTVVQDNQSSGAAYHRSDFEKDLNLIVEMGATAVRSMGGAQSNTAYDLLDEQGVVAWVDMPFSSDIIYGGKGFADQFMLRENGRTQLLETIFQYYNHPSICFWGIFDKIATTGDDPLEYIVELNALAKRESPDRITVATSIEDGAINRVTDVIAWPSYYGWEKGVASDFNIWVKQLKDNFANLKGGVAEYGSAADIYGLPSDDKGGESSVVKRDVNVISYPQTSQALFHEQYLAGIEKNPIFWGTFINSMFDYCNGDLNDGEKDGYNLQGVVSYDRNYRKDAFYLYKANWNEFDKFIHIVGKEHNRISSEKQSIKVYTNLKEAKLVVNGVDMGSREAVNGVIVWEDIPLAIGENRIFAAGSSCNDSAIFKLFNTLEK